MNCAIIATADHLPQAHQLGEQLHLPVFTSIPPNFDFFLHVGQRLALSSASDLHCLVYSEFSHETMGYRLAHGGGRQQLLARACGLKPHKNPDILDLTAGLGNDGFILASLGCHVTLLERQPIIAALLNDGLQRAAQQRATQAICHRIFAIQTNSLTYLQQTPVADVIYLDPMYPKRQKSAKVNKNMQLFQKLVGEDADARQLLPLALACARQRVVVKRPKNAPHLSEKQPSMMLDSKKTRYDVYMRHPIET
jgi:16S rRNA (guanine1516-N2)-methyltransferase